VDYNDACERLRNHANMPTSLAESESLGFALWRLSKGQLSGEWARQLKPLLTDVIDCLEIVNVTVNGQIPSQTRSEHKSSAIDRWLCYYVSSLLDLCARAYTSISDDSVRAAVFAIMSHVCFAWSCVLAGDIDSIKQELVSAIRCADLPDVPICR